MAKNYASKLSGQIGENLVVAELGRRGIVATTLAGNVPDIDVLAFANGKSVGIQVKSIRRGTLTVDASHYLDIEIQGHRQIVSGVNASINREAIFVVVAIGSAYGSDKFYVFRQGALQDTILRNHSAFLARNNGIRPRAPESTHCSYGIDDISEYQDLWKIIDEALDI